MTICKRYYVAGYKLQIYSSAFLIEAEPCEKNCTHTIPDELPGWVFHSKNAVWMKTLDAPMMDKAIEGDRIKNEILHVLQDHKALTL